MSPLRVAIAGLGKIASDQHIPAISAHPGLQLIATADPHVRGIVGTPHFSSLEDMLLAAREIEAVILCCPPQVRTRLAHAALAAGKHVLLEKPPASTVAEAEALGTLAQQMNRSIFTAWHSRYAGGVSGARDWLAGKKVRIIDIRWCEDVRKWHPGQPWIWEHGGMGVFDPGINALSILTHILPDGFVIEDSELSVPENREAPIAARLLLRGPAKATAYFDWRHSGEECWDIMVSTDEGDLRLSAGGSILALPDGEQRFEDAEYAAIYSHFVEVVAAGNRAFDLDPLRLAEAALQSGDRITVPAFND